MSRSERGFNTPELLATLLFGTLLGAGLFTFGYARGYSYLTDSPRACANCHIMRGHYESWLKSSHHKAAVCNDCHTPAGLAPKYSAKASNGFRHSLAFTTGRFPDEIEITTADLTITEHACLKCHADMVSVVSRHDNEVSCVRCHRNVGHL
jgi:cytochrome c nitrite reductase small subunit